MAIIDNRITIAEFLKVGLLGVEEYIKTGNTYFNVLDRLGFNSSDITPEEFLQVGLQNVKDWVEAKKNANKYNL